MSRPYVSGASAELYQQRAHRERKELRNRRLFTVLSFTGFIALDVYLLWPVA